MPKAKSNPDAAPGFITLSIPLGTVDLGTYTPEHIGDLRLTRQEGLFVKRLYSHLQASSERTESGWGIENYNEAVVLLLQQCAKGMEQR